MSENNENIQTDEEGDDVVFMKCRRGEQQGGSCGGDVAYITKIKDGTHRYQCKKCDGVWTLSVGGSFNI